MSNEQRPKVAGGSVVRQRATPEPKPSVLKNAGEAVGLIAGVVALTYVLGGLVLVLRLVTDGYRAEQAVAVIGELPRERVVSLGFVEVVASAAIVGIVAAVIAAAFNLPSHHRDERSLRQPRVLLPLLCLASVLTTVVVLLIFVVSEEEWRPRFWLNILAIPFTFFTLMAAWRALRLAGGGLEHRASRVILVGFVFTVVAIPATLFAAAVARFEEVRLCVVGYDDARTGRLIALTKDSAVMLRDDAKAREYRTIVSFPGDKITRSDIGDTAELSACPEASASSGTAADTDQPVAGVREGRQAGREAGRQAGQHAGRKAGREAGRQAGQHAGRKAGREAGRQAGRNAGRRAGATASR